VERGSPRNYESQPASSVEVMMRLPSSRYRNWIELLEDEFVDIRQIAQRDQIRKGEILHLILSFVRDLSRQNLQACLKQAQSHLSQILPTGVDLTVELAVVRGVAAHGDFRNFFYLQEGMVFTEYELVNRWGHSKRIDRIIITSQEVWIVDYKLSRLVQDDYHQQVREYMNLAAELYPGRTVKGFLLYVQELAWEEVFIQTTAMTTQETI
jgi:ATP-dependent exoDNAse (exonuclease V) beta subunit